MTHRSIHSYIKIYFRFVIIFTAVVILGTNTIVKRDLPLEPIQRIQRLQAAEHYLSAEIIYRNLLNQNPLDIDLNYNYIQNHYNIPSISEYPRDDKAIKAYYRGLTADLISADIGYLGLGLIYSLETRYRMAVLEFLRVNNTRLKYLNNSIGYAYTALHDDSNAERYYKKEIEIKGNVRGAVRNLTRLLLKANRFSELEAIINDSDLGKHVGLSEKRRVALMSGDVLAYLKLTFYIPLLHIHWASLATALIICTMWFIYFWRIDVFEQEPMPYAIAVVCAGAFFALTGFIFNDLLMRLVPLQLSGRLFGDLMYSIIHIGVVEEIVKFIPVILIILLTREINEPIDLIVYGSLSALGFATLENSLYLSGYGLGIVFGRFLISTILHLGMTSVACYMWARAKYFKKANEFISVILGIALAAVIHGLFDYFLLGPLKSLSWISILIALVLAVFYGQMMRICLNHSPFFKRDKMLVRRLSNYELMIGTGLLLLLISYTFDTFYFSTAIANYRTLQILRNTVVSVVVIFGALNEITLRKKPRFWTGVIRKLKF